MDEINGAIYEKTLNLTKSPADENIQARDSSWKLKKESYNEYLEDLENEIREEKLLNIKMRNSSRRHLSSSEDPNPEYVSVYSKELVDSIIPYMYLLSNEERRRCMKKLEKEKGLKEEVALYLSKARNNELILKEDLLEENSQILRDS